MGGLDHASVILQGAQTTMNGTTFWGRNKQCQDLFKPEKLF
jgi:hypothetical protein